MKRFFAWILVPALILMGGCTRNVDDFNEDGTRFEATGVEGDFETTQEDGEVAEVETEDTAGEAAEEEEPEPEGYPSGISDEEYFGIAFDRGDVESNGTGFVRVGERVYFLKYGQGSFSEPALFGNFLSTPSPSANGVLMYYDLPTGEVVDTQNIIDVAGSLYAGPKGIYLTGHDSGTEEVSLYKPDGSGHVNLGEGYVMGVSDDGKYVAVNSYTDDFVRVFSIYDNEKKVSAISAMEGENFSFCGMTDKGLIYKVYDPGRDVNEIRQLDMNGAVTKLGKMPAPEAAEEYGAEIVQLLKDGEKLYFNVVYFEGTGHFLAEQTVLTAIDGKKDSLEAMNVKPTEKEDEERYNRLYMSGHTLLASSYACGEIELSNGYWGDLVMYDPTSVSVNLIKGFVDDPESDIAKEGMGETMIQETAVIADHAFIIAADCERDEESDIGWREAYRLLNLKYLCVPVEEGDKDVITLADSEQEW